MEVVAKGRKYEAHGILVGNKLTVLKDSCICPVGNRCLPEDVVKFRNDNRIVDGNHHIICDVEFSSPSFAADFVTGNVSNGRRVWKNVTTLKSIGNEKWKN